MKKISLLITFLFCAIFSFAQYVPVPQGLPNQNLQAQGMQSAKLGFGLPVKDTLNNKAVVYVGALTVRPQDTAITLTPPIYMSNGHYWFNIGVNAVNRHDTLFAQLPLYFDSLSHPGSTIIKFLQQNGVIGGIVTIDSCRNLSVSAGIATINFTSYAFAFTQLVVPAADPSNPRQDYVVVDTFGLVQILTGTPASPALPPSSYNPSSQFILASYTIGAAASCLGISQEIIYDQHTGSPEWTVTTSGTISNDPANTLNPYHLTIADNISIYTTGSQIIFTKPSGTDTVQATEILKAFIYFNGLFPNQIQAQWFNGSTAMSNNIVLNPYFNKNDSNQYQLLAVPFSAWSFTSSIFNKLVLTFQGNDISGAQGLFMDWIQIQSGILNAQEPPPPAWLLTGNGATTPGANFLGTTNNQGLMFKINNVQAGFLGTTSTYNATFGIATLPFTATGTKNTAIGGAALGLSTTGFNNTAIGYTSLYHDTTQPYNTGIGWGSIGWNNGIGNTAVGYASLNSTISSVHNAQYNTSIGYEALQNSLDHSYNIGLGVQAGQLSTSILGSVAKDSTLYVSNFTKNMYFNLDSVGGTAPYTIGMDSNKFWHVYNGSGGGGSETWQQTLINGSQFSQDNDVDLNGFHFAMVYDGINWIYASPAEGTTSLSAYDETQQQSSYLNLIGHDDLATADINAVFGDGAKGSHVYLSANASVSTITQDADSSIINGVLELKTVPSGAITDSILTRDAATGIVNMRDAASFGGTTNPAGQNKWVQYNDNGVFGADSNFVWNKDSSILTLANTGVVSQGVTISTGFINGSSIPSGINIDPVDAPIGSGQQGGFMEFHSGKGDDASSGGGAGFTAGDGGDGGGLGGQLTLSAGNGGALGNGGIVVISAGNHTDPAYHDGNINLITGGTINIGASGAASTLIDINNAYTIPVVDGTATQVITTNGSGTASWQNASFKGSFSQVGTATTAFTVTIGTTQVNNTYNVQVTPTAALSAALFYISAKTTTTFTVTYLTGLTGTVTFDWLLTP